MPLPVTYVLVVTPVAEDQETIRKALEATGVEVRIGHDAERAWEVIERGTPSSAVIDLYLSDVSGFAMCRMLREEARTSGMPVLLVTGASVETERILALELGADDVVSRPFFPRELALRVRALIRRSRQNGEGQAMQVVEHGPIQLDLQKRLVRVNGQRVHLTDKELEVLLVLMRRPGRVFSRSELLERAWGVDRARTPRVVDTHVKGIRRKLGDDGALVESLRGVGYRLCAGLPPLMKPT